MLAELLTQILPLQHLLQNRQEEQSVLSCFTKTSLSTGCTSDGDGILIFRKSKKGYDKWENQIIERFDGNGKIFYVFEVSKQQCKMVLALFF
jgi:hypothetical protein